MFLLFIFFLFTGAIAFASYSFLLKIKNSPKHILRSWLFVSSRKSSSDAILLGGMVINSCAALAIAVCHYILSVPNLLMLNALPSLAIIFIHGYLDDKHEISPRFKLLCQLTSVGVFTLMSAPLLPTTLWVSLPLMMLIGFAVLNGANLLDGLDTMQMKLSSFSLIFYMAVAILYDSSSVVSIALICLSSLLAFYPFNREPAKIHMGEIGANSVGMIFLALSTELYAELSPRLGIYQALVISAIPLALPIVELSTSFIRRLAAKRSPFKSDRLHIHHILTDHYQFSAGGSATLIMLTFALSGIISLFFCYMSPWYALIFEYTSLYFCYWRIGQKVWSRKSVQNKVLYAAKMTRLKKRKLTVIDCSTIDNFQMTFYRQEKAQPEIRQAS